MSNQRANKHQFLKHNRTRYKYGQGYVSRLYCHISSIRQAEIFALNGDKSKKCIKESGSESNRFLSGMERRNQSMLLIPRQTPSQIGLIDISRQMLCSSCLAFSAWEPLSEKLSTQPVTVT